MPSATGAEISSLCSSEPLVFRIYSTPVQESDDKLERSYISDTPSMRFPSVVASVDSRYNKDIATVMNISSHCDGVGLSRQWKRMASSG